MGNGVSGDQGNLPAHGKRDVREGIDAMRHDWSELARTREIVTSPPIPTSYNGTSNVWPESSAEDKMCVDADVRSLPTTCIGATTARLESSTGSSIHVDASGAEFKPTIGNMYDIAEHEYDDAVTSEFNTGNTSRLQ